MPFPPLFAAALAATGITATPCAPPPDAAAQTDAQRADLARRTDWANLCRYRADNERLRQAPAAARRVVFMGDSITENWQRLDPGFFRDGWIDRGISGQTTPQMLVRFPADVIALHPRVVHIMAGTNDIAGNTGPTTLDAVEANIAAMVVLAKAAGIRVVLAATPPSAGFAWAPELRPAPQIAELNRRLRALARRERVTFVDYGTALATPAGAMRPELSNDGTHPTAAGYAAIEPIARRTIAALLAGGGGGPARTRAR